MISGLQAAACPEISGPGRFRCAPTDAQARGIRAGRGGAGKVRSGQVTLALGRVTSSSEFNTWPGQATEHRDRRPDAAASVLPIAAAPGMIWERAIRVHVPQLSA